MISVFEVYAHNPELLILVPPLAALLMALAAVAWIFWTARGM